MVSLDVFMCVHEQDINYLFPTAFCSYLLNFSPKKRLFIVTTNPAALHTCIEKFDLSVHNVIVTSDMQWLSVEERLLPGWYKQQIIKLRAYEFCESNFFCNLGADTLLLRKIDDQNLIDSDQAILYYNRYPTPSSHLDYERKRLSNIANILGISPSRSWHYGDFILDFFCFDRNYLQSLNQYLYKKYGKDCYYRLFRDRTAAPAERVLFGEWTLYSSYVLDCIEANPPIRNSLEHQYLKQVHRNHDLLAYKFDSSVVHFVDKNFDVDFIKRRLREYQIYLCE